MTSETPEELQTKAAITVKVIAEGCRAHRAGLKLSDTPYASHTAEHWVWRLGYIQSFKDSIKGRT